MGQLTGSLRLGIVSLIVFFLLGLALLPLVNVGRAMEQSKAPQAVIPGPAELVS